MQGYYKETTVTFRVSSWVGCNREMVTFKFSSWLVYYRETITFKFSSWQSTTGRQTTVTFKVSLRRVYTGRVYYRENCHF